MPWCYPSGGFCKIRNIAQSLYLYHLSTSLSSHAYSSFPRGRQLLNRVWNHNSSHCSSAIRVAGPGLNINTKNGRKVLFEFRIFTYSKKWMVRYFTNENRFCTFDNNNVSKIPQYSALAKSVQLFFWESKIFEKLFLKRSELLE